MATVQATTPPRAFKRVVKIPHSNAVIRLDIDEFTWKFAIADDQRFRRLFDIVERNIPDGCGDVDTYYSVERLCPKCKKMNSIEVTDKPGYPKGGSGIWHCDNCSHALAKIDAIRGRVSVRQRDIEPVAVTVADVLATMRRIEAQDAENEREAYSAGIPHERFGFIPPVGATDTLDDLDDVPF